MQRFICGICLESGWFRPGTGLWVLRGLSEAEAKWDVDGLMGIFMQRDLMGLASVLG